MYLTPKRLIRGSKVAIVAPASPFRTDELIAGLDIVKAMGLEPVLGPNVTRFQVSDVEAAPVMDRADELMWAFTDPEIDGVITVLGGIGSGGTLPLLDFDAIRGSRRVLIGLSDITALNNGILAAAGLISVNCQYPSIRISEGKRLRDSDSESLKFALEMLMSAEPWAERPFAINELMPRTLSPGKASGHVIGGNLDTLCTLLGTPFMPDCKDAILFLEDVHKDGEVVSRLLLHLQLAGVLDQVAGIVVGEFAEEPIQTGYKVPSIESVLTRYLTDGPPCSYGYSFSHGPMTIPIPIGAQCDMDADTGRVSFNFTMGRG